MDRKEITQKIIDSKVVAVIRLNKIEQLDPVALALLEGGITSLEVTLTIPNALEGIKNLAEKFGDKIMLGAGSVLNTKAAEDAINAGANYIVSPILSKEIIKYCHSRNIPSMPGAFTPTEIFEAHTADADIVKVFPADIVGMEFFKAVKAPMPMLNMMPTGGVTLTNINDWLNSGACAVGIGSALVDKKAVAEGNYSKLTDNAKFITENLK